MRKEGEGFLNQGGRESRGKTFSGDTETCFPEKNYLKKEDPQQTRYWGSHHSKVQRQKYCYSDVPKWEKGEWGEKQKEMAEANKTFDEEEEGGGGEKGDRWIAPMIILLQIFFWQQ